MDKATDEMINNFATLGNSKDNIIYTDKFIDDEDRIKIMDYLLNRTYPPKNHNGFHAVHKEDILSESPEIYELTQKYAAKGLELISNTYTEKYGIKFRNHQYLPCYFAKMDPGMNNGRHRDFNDSNAGSFSHHAVIMMYFNDEYTGGEISFIEQGVSYKPVPGCSVLFPANYLHEVTRLETGNRYAAMMVYSFDS